MLPLKRTMYTVHPLVDAFSCVRRAKRASSASETASIKPTPRLRLEVSRLVLAFVPTCPFPKPFPKVFSSLGDSLATTIRIDRLYNRPLPARLALTDNTQSPGLRTAFTALRLLLLPPCLVLFETPVKGVPRLRKGRLLLRQMVRRPPGTTTTRAKAKVFVETTVEVHSRKVLSWPTLRR